MRILAKENSLNIYILIIYCFFMKPKKLTPKEEDVIVKKGTEPPFSGQYDKHFEKGLYVCKQCGKPLYRSQDKYDAHCGWPSFDDELPGAVKRLPDPDGVRTEIQCANCGAHLGHVFKGEHQTPKNVRHCVNSISMDFIPAEKVEKEIIVLGGGCFWCTEAVFSMVPGILSVESGYAGGMTDNPTYDEVCSGGTDHAEVVKLEYYIKFIKLGKILEIFFAMHDPTSLNQQGSDVGTQYRSIILFTSKKQERVITDFIKKIQDDYTKPIVTEAKPLEKFYPAEDYHKDYYKKNSHKSYCIMVISPKVKKIKKEFDL
jgi:peptide methionine sulfoxide reductase msrA/msrB